MSFYIKVETMICKCVARVANAQKTVEFDATNHVPTSTANTIKNNMKVVVNLLQIMMGAYHLTIHVESPTSNEPTSVSINAHKTVTNNICWLRGGKPMSS